MGNSFFNGIAGPKPAGSNQIKNLLAYLEANPQAFDPAELDAAFANLADGGIEGTNYEFWLYKDGPSPQCWWHAKVIGSCSKLTAKEVRNELSNQSPIGDA